MSIRRPLTRISLLQSSAVSPAFGLRVPRLSRIPDNNTRGYSSRTQQCRPASRRVNSPRTAPFTPRACYSTNEGYENESTYRFPSSGPNEPTITAAFENTTGTWQYIVSDPKTLTAVIIDAVLDYDRTTQNVSTESADAILNLVKENGYKISMILETHIHADHLTSASYLQSRIAEIQGQKVPIGIGARMEKMQKMFGERYGISADEYTGVFGKLFRDDEVFKIGELSAMAIHLPGHTPDHLGYKIGDNIFCGDSVFHPDIGTARTDFPGGSATDLFHSTRKLLNMPDNTKVWTGHDYPPPGRGSAVPWLSVGSHRAQNKHLVEGMSEAEFVKVRQERDKQLAEPKLLHQSLQTNIRGGRLPKVEAGRYRFLKLPMKLQGVEW